MKTNSWLSPILWADSFTLIYPDNGVITNGDKHPLYQLPIYPVPRSVYYSKTTTEENRFLQLNQIDPEDPNSSVPEGLFIRKMPIFSLYDTQQFNPAGGHDPNDQSLNIYALSSIYTSPALEINPGFNSSHIRVNRIGDWDAQLELSATDDPGRPPSISSDAWMHLDMARGSPFIQMTTSSIPAMNLTFWHGNSFILQNATIQVQGQNISWNLVTTQMRNSGVPGPGQSWSQAQTWNNETYLFFYPADKTILTIETLPDVVNRYQNLMFSRDLFSFSFNHPEEQNYLVAKTLDNPADLDTTLLWSLAQAAFCYPTNTKTTYQYSGQGGTVTAKYDLTTSNVLGLTGDLVQGLLPLHYGNFFGLGSVLTSSASFITNGTGIEPKIQAMKGDIRFLKGSSFTCTYNYPGILPYMPSIPVQDTAGRENLTQWMADIDSQYTTGAWSDWKYTGMDSPIDTYGAGKRLWRRI